MIEIILQIILGIIISFLGIGLLVTGFPYKIISCLIGILGICIVFYAMSNSIIVAGFMGLVLVTTILYIYYVYSVRA